MSNIYYPQNDEESDIESDPRSEDEHPEQYAVPVNKRSRSGVPNISDFKKRDGGKVLDLPDPTPQHQIQQPDPMQQSLHALREEIRIMREQQEQRAVLADADIDEEFFEDFFNGLEPDAPVRRAPPPAYGGYPAGGAYDQYGFET